MSHIKSDRAQYSVQALRLVLDVSPQAWHAYLGRDPAEPQIQLVAGPRFEPARPYLSLESPGQTLGQTLKAKREPPILTIHSRNANDEKVLESSVGLRVLLDAKIGALDANPAGTGARKR